MEEHDLRDLKRLFAHPEDPCMERTTRHLWRENIMQAIYRAQGWAAKETCGKAKEAVLTDLLGKLFP